jgi:transposase
MPIRIIKVQLTLEDRKRLETILRSPKSTLNDKQKAEVLLLTDIGEYGKKISPGEAAAKVGLSTRSVGRIREVYAKNSIIDDVFRFAKLSNQASCRVNNVKKPMSSKSKKGRYIETEDNDNAPILIENVKCRVTLSKEEREQLEAVLKEGKQTARKFNRAKILLLADEGFEGPAMTDKEIADKLDVSVITVARVRRLFITKGQINDVLNFTHQNAGRPSKIDGTIQATLIAQACSAPPEGRCKWTVRLLATRLVELEVIDSISHTAVGNALKKMNLSLGNEKNG